MNKIREILRLSSHKLGQRQISRSLNISVGAVNKYLNSAEKIGLTWQAAAKMDDKLLMEKLDGTNVVIDTSFNMPDFERIIKKLKKKGVTLMLLHAEYKAINPNNHYSYRRFCELYRNWQKDKKICLRQEYKAGDKMFVDYAGPTVPIFDEHDNKVQDAQIFVAVMAASNYTYIESTADQKLESWLNSHVRAFEYFGGVPRLVVPVKIYRLMNFYTLPTRQYDHYILCH